MTVDIKPIKVYGKGGPNPPRVAILLAELDLPHEIIPIPFSKVKEPEYTAINPNGRLPAIYDPNTDLTLWESGAIVEYLIEQYDPSHSLSFPAGSNDAFHAKQWLFFQASGQGPYYGQAAWFKSFHHEHVPSAIERYVKEINRVTGVLEAHLAAQEVPEGSDGPWLVGGRYSFADLAWISWQFIIARVIKKEDGYDVEKFPVVKAWLDRMLAREAVKKVLVDAEPVF